MQKYINRMLLIINLKTLIVTTLSIASTYLCLKHDLHSKFPLTILTTAVIFPVVFSIGGAYKRREAALDQYGSIKAHCRAIFFASRDWQKDKENENSDQMKIILNDLFDSFKIMFISPLKDIEQNEKQVYVQFSRLSKFLNEEVRSGAISPGEVSRVNQYLSKLILSFEKVKHIYQYRTPRTLRAFSILFLTVLPPLYGPYFAALAKESSAQLTYIMPILFSVILVSLDSIQIHLENPFDQIGEDDIQINSEKFVKYLEL